MEIVGHKEPKAVPVSVLMEMWLELDAKESPVTINIAMFHFVYQRQQQRQPRLQLEQQTHHNHKLNDMPNLLPFQILKKVTTIMVPITTAFTIESQN